MEAKKPLADARFAAGKMVKVNLFETPRFFCDIYCLRPGQAQKVHSHAESDKLYFVLRGRGKVTVGSEERVLEEGEIVLAAAGEPHGIANESGADLVCLVFMAPHPDFKSAEPAGP
jgi:quercetin dioxygenase-like cupin family protein